MIQIDQAFNPETKSVHSFYQSPGIGFYIPLYQRPYSWDIDNIEQLLDDISKGVENMLINEKDEIRFLGTIITVIETNKKSIEPQDPYGLPSSIENVIDGQQRISTISMLASELLFSIKVLRRDLSKTSDFSKHVEEICNNWENKLIEVLSLDLKRGKPNRKPKIIRGNTDAWTKDGSIGKYYQSPVAKYLATAIENIENNVLKPPIVNKTENDKVYTNIKKFRTWIKDTVLVAHIKKSDDFPDANAIIKKFNQENLWDYERDEISDEIEKKEFEDKKSASSRLASLTQIISACHYLLDRCCFTSIQPKNDDWAFDMFQSLNATGTPLTAIETFHPLVVNITNQNEGSYKKSDAHTSFNAVDNLFKDTNTAAQKSKLSNDFLTSFRIAVDGNKLESHFSKQRKWLQDIYIDKCDDYKKKKNLINYLGNYSKYFKNVWIDYDGLNGIFPAIAGTVDAELASLLILLLKDSKHKMSVTILANFYQNILEKKDSGKETFIQSVKIISAFYILWRSAKSNSGLDDVYRDFFKGKEGLVKSHCWLVEGYFKIGDLKKYLAKILKQESIYEKKDWVTKATKKLNYNNSKIITRLGLYIESHDNIPDKDTGLVKQGAKNCNPYLDLEKWTSKDLKTIEHIAPETKTDFWSESLYDEDETYHNIGNLTLLPLDVNVSAGNKSIEEKLVYYKHLGEKDMARRKELSDEAEKKGIKLSDQTIEMLVESNYMSHIDHIIKKRKEIIWDKNFVQNRSKRIANIIYDLVITWFNCDI